MKSNKAPRARTRYARMVSLTKTLVLWVMLIFGIVLVTRQVRSTDSDVKISLHF